MVPPPLRSPRGSSADWSRESRRSPPNASGLANGTLREPRSIFRDWSEGAASYLKEARSVRSSVRGLRRLWVLSVPLSCRPCKTQSWARPQFRLQPWPGETMAKVSVLNVAVLENPSPFHSPFRFEISFECNEALADDLEWKIIYVGSAESEEFDQILDSVLVGPVPAGRHMFVFQADAPNPSLIPESDAIGVTVVLITCTYHGQEFIRVGYYVNNEYPDPELRENPPPKPDFSQLQRNILASNPRVTRFHINWDNNTDRLEAIENQDPTLSCSPPINCTPVKGLGLPSCVPGLLPENSMDCI